MNNPITVSFLRWLIIFPLFGSAINLTLGPVIQRRVGKFAVSAVGCGSVLASLAVALHGLRFILSLPPQGRYVLDSLWPWIHVGGLQLDIAFWLDPLSLVMVLVITGVGGLIHIYATAYMHDDDSYWRFFGWFNLFVFAMLVLVLADNLWLMFVGWEGVGLCSYALIGFWYQTPSNCNAANKAFIVNRVGDWAFVMALYTLYNALTKLGHPTLVIRELAVHANSLAQMPAYLGMSTATFATLLLFGGATGKSAQIPLQVWLPDAMAGPTPVSALIHAATMVTAGVYMIARLSFLYAVAPATLAVVALVGTLTAFIAATVALVQNDIKKVLAYSTISQLGYMFTAVGVGAFTAGIFHLVTHAFFKACLFLGAGSVIHSLAGEQDMRRMGGLAKRLPATFATFLVATLAICGLPPFAGFMSKDEILWEVLKHGHPVLWLLTWLAAGLTALYMFRQVYLTFSGSFRGDSERWRHAHEAPAAMTAVNIALALLSLTGGVLLLPHYVAEFRPLEAFLSPVFAPAERALSAASTASPLAISETVASIAAIAIAVSGWLIADLGWRARAIDPARWAELAHGYVYRALANSYYFDTVYNALLVYPYLRVCQLLGWFDRAVVDAAVNGCATATTFFTGVIGRFDKRVVDGLVNALSDATLDAGGRLRRLQTGSINNYVYVILIGVFVMLLARAIAGI